MGVDLVAVAVSLLDLRRAIQRGDVAVAVEHSGIGAEPHRAAKVAPRRALLEAALTHPFGDQANDRLGRFAELGCRGVGEADGISRAFDARHLHAEADAEERHAPLAGEFDRGDLALAAALAKAAGDENAVERFQFRCEVWAIALEQFSVEPADVDLRPVGEAAVNQRFSQRFIGIGQPDIFADDADGDFAFMVVEAIHDVVPARQVGARRIDTEHVEHGVVETLFMIAQRNIVDRARVERRDHRRDGDVAEQRDLLAVALRQGPVAAAQQHVGLDAEAGQFAHRMLRRFGLQLPRRGDPRHQRRMYGDGPIAAKVVAQLAQRLDERQALDVADGAADLADDEVDPVCLVEREFLDRVGNVRDDLNRRAEIVAAPLARDDVAVDAAGGDIIRLLAVDAGKALVMAKVEIGLGAVVGDVDFAVLIGRHRPRIDVEIGVELADADGEATRLEERAERGGEQAFTER